MRDVSNEATSSLSGFYDSIAVLPFANGGGGPEAGYLSDGMTTGLVKNLSRLRELRVVPHASALMYKGNIGDAVRAGRELRVRVVLVGQVAQLGEEVVVNVELIDTDRELHLWKAHYYSTIEDIFPAHAEIAADVANRLHMRLNDEQKKLLTKRPTESREAYYLYLKAAHWASKWTPEALRKGFDYIQAGARCRSHICPSLDRLSIFVLTDGHHGWRFSFGRLSESKGSRVESFGDR